MRTWPDFSWSVQLLTSFSCVYFRRACQVITFLAQLMTFAVTNEHVCWLRT